VIRTMDSNTARAQWRAVIDEAAAGAASIVVTRYGKPAIAIIAYDEFAAMKGRLATGRRAGRATIRRPRKQLSARSHPYFNSARKDARRVEDVINELRDGRYHAL
jgi:prevent-host-death family protein